MTESISCPCDLGKPYPSCCGRWHAGRPAPTALMLMRSRYSAFVLELEDYLLGTWLPDTRPERLELSSETTWTGLTILAHEDGQAWHEQGTVTFRATYSTPDGSYELLERSFFELVAGRWFYVTG